MLKEILRNSQGFYICIHCDYTTSRKCDFIKHLSSLKHKTKQNANKCYNNAKQNSKYTCYCGRSYRHQSSFSRHTAVCNKIENDDKWMTNGLQMDDTPTSKDKFVCRCGKKYKYRQGLHKHKSSCKLATPTDENYEIIEKIKDILPNLTGNNTINYNVNNINQVVNNNAEHINIYLNEKCGNAMSIQDFASQLSFTIDDLLMKKRECLTNVLLKNIQPLSITQRPFHCSNINNKEWHVKDEKDGWEKDNGEKILRNTEFEINKKWTTEFEKEYPDWMNKEKMKDVYVKVTQKATSELPKKEESKMLKELGEEVFMVLR